ncbi:MAG: amidohydrolase [Candidatus Bathyarchaeota archaeon]|jgi:5-methylthioadenosine/S-adenosylhomocysteine deaminase
MNLLIQNGTIIPMNHEKVIRQGAVVVEDKIIVDIGKTSDLKSKYRTGYEKIDAKEKVIIPGLINTHQHAAMSLLRGFADDLPLQQWLEEWIWPIEKHLNPHSIYVGALLTAVESIMGGTTTVNTMYHYRPEENEARAFSEVKLRGVVGHVCFSWRKREDKTALEDLTRKWHNKVDGLTRVSVDPHSPYTVDSEYLKELKDIREELTEKYGTQKAPIISHIHIAETNDEPSKIRNAFNVKLKNGVMKYLDSLDVLDEHVIAAHCVALEEEDIEIMKKKEVKASHNPISNLKLASGISPVPRMLREGIIVSLGTDSPCSNNTADMFQTMKMTALLHKGVNKDPTLTPARQVLEMATMEGAKALSWQDEIGSLEVGKKADLVIIDLHKPHLYPMYNEESHLVYAAKSEDVDTVIINGEIVMENRNLTTINVGKVLMMAEKAKARLLERMGKQD